MRWMFPLAKAILGPTADSDSFRKLDIESQAEIPIGSHIGSFGAERRIRRHEGIDLYGLEGDIVRAVEDGVVVHVEWFTGPRSGFSNEGRWTDTMAVLVEGESGVVCYGEIMPCPSIYVGKNILRGDKIGMVLRVYARDSARPRDMLHLELYEPGIRHTVEWLGSNAANLRPAGLLDPTEHLLQATEL